MYSIARLPEDERRILFRNTAQKMGMNEAIIEKDFWVCLTLDYLFHRCEWKDVFTFKGGTSLSKCYGLITRFSEDIDLILDWRAIGYSLNEPWEDRSNTKQDAFNKEANARAEVFLRDTLLPIFKRDLSEIIGQEATIYIEESDPQTINFEYLELLKKVVNFKMKFFPRKWAKYEEAIPGTIKLVPPAFRFDSLRTDYEDMAEMMFGQYPSFDDLMDYIQTLENEINAL